VCRTDNLVTFMCRLSRNSGILSLLEPEEPVQACNGITLTPDFYFVIGDYFFLNCTDMLKLTFFLVIIV